MLGSCVESYLETEFVAGHVAAVGDDDDAVRGGLLLCKEISRHDSGATCVQQLA